MATVMSVSSAFGRGGGGVVIDVIVVVTLWLGVVGSGTFRRLEIVVGSRVIMCLVDAFEATGGGGGEGSEIDGFVVWVFSFRS